MAARSIGKGSISFGLVNIPIQVFSAAQKEDYTSFNQLCEKGHKIRYNNYVVLEKEEIKKIKLKTTNTIEIKEFIESQDFDPIFVEKNYYIGPDSGKK